MFLFKYQNEIVCLIVFLHICNLYLTPFPPKEKKEKEIKKKITKLTTKKTFHISSIGSLLGNYWLLDVL